MSERSSVSQRRHWVTLFFMFIFGRRELPPLNQKIVLHNRSLTLKSNLCVHLRYYHYQLPTSTYTDHPTLSTFHIDNSPVTAVENSQIQHRGLAFRLSGSCASQLKQWCHVVASDSKMTEKVQPLLLLTSSRVIQMSKNRKNYNFSAPHF